MLSAIEAAELCDNACSLPASAALMRYLQPGLEKMLASKDAAENIFLQVSIV
jgi:hypothetical protein